MPTVSSEDLTGDQRSFSFSCYLQDFMKVYATLREDLLADELIAGQPGFSADYMRKVI